MWKWRLINTSEVVGNRTAESQTLHPIFSVEFRDCASVQKVPYFPASFLETDDGPHLCVLAGEEVGEPCHVPADG